MATILRVRTDWSGGAVAGSLSTHYFGPNASAATAADAQAVVDLVRNFWTALNPGIQAGIVWTTESVVDQLDDVGGLLLGSFATVARTGTGSTAGDPLPYQTQGLVRWNTATVADGHRLRGHTFIPAPLESENGAGAPAVAYVTRLGTAAAAMLAAAPYQLVVWHRPIHDAAGALVRPGSNGIVTGGAGQGSWAVLRSRRS